MMKSSDYRETEEQELEAYLGFELPQEIHDFEPIGNRILVKKMDPEERTKAGILIPETSQKTGGGGVVVKVGHLVGTTNTEPGAAELPLEMPGDLVGCHVVFSQFAGEQIKFNTWQNAYEGEFALMMVRDIWGFNVVHSLEGGEDVPCS